MLDHFGLSLSLLKIFIQHRGTFLAQLAAIFPKTHIQAILVKEFLEVPLGNYP
jgi:hypothetical protein